MASLLLWIERRQVRDSRKLLAWELGCVAWISFAGSALHFAFELSDYWTPMAVVSAVNESIWEHLKIYFWPGLLFALVQYTYTREYANNYWLGKLVALFTTPVLITAMYYGYMGYLSATNSEMSVTAILMIMFLGVLAGQLCSWRILCSEPYAFSRAAEGSVAAGYVILTLMFSLFTFFPPKVFLFENYLCYEYTAEYGILDDYEPYRVFRKADEPAESGNSIWYCQTNTIT